jgi:hypothetical protein
MELNFWCHILKKGIYKTDIILPSHETFFVQLKMFVIWSNAATVFFFYHFLLINSRKLLLSLMLHIVKTDVLFKCKPVMCARASLTFPHALFVADTKDLQGTLYKEMRSTTKEEDCDVPVRQGPYFYYTRTLEGQQYGVHCRRAIVAGAGPGHVDEVMNTGDEAPREEILLDENVEAKEYEFYHVGDLKVNNMEPLIMSYQFCVVPCLGLILT